MNKTDIIHNSPDVKEIWAGIGGHFDSLGQIINEFVDNSISNFDANSTLETKSILIQLKELEKDGPVEVTIEDTGTGIKNLDAAFTLGGRAGAESPLNEHGFGLKHALASANPGNDKWAVYTKNEEDAAQDRFRIIKAPYKIGEYAIEMAYTSEQSWPGTYNHKTGTLVRFVCSRDMYRTIYKRPTDFTKIADALIEDLGFTYANIISSARAMITVKIVPKDGDVNPRNVGALVPDWEEYIAPASGKEKIDLGGGMVELEYCFGRFYELGERELFNNSTAARHYKHSMSSSGVEIRLNGRIICSNLFSEIWGIERHNSYNNFLVQINLTSNNSDALPQTRTSKNGLREGDEKLEALFKWIRSKMSKPPKDTSLADNEVERFVILKEKFEKQRGKLAKEQSKSYVCETEKHVFNTSNARDKVRLDLYESIGEDVFIYEGKIDWTSSKDVYQLRMYWDGLIYDNITPTKGYLVANEHPDSVKELISIVNTMEDANGNSYNLEAITWESLDIGSDR